MASTNISQQTSTAVPLQAGLARTAPQPLPLQRRILAGRLQWALDGPGWSLLRPALDFLLVCVAVTLAVGGVGAVLHPGAMRLPLLAMPPLVTVLFYLETTTVENGCTWLVPGSHFYPGVGGNRLEEDERLRRSGLLDQAVPLPMPAGGPSGQVRC